MQRVSSQVTLFLRIAVPTIWMTAVLAIVVLLGWAVQGKANLFGNPFLWVSLVLILGAGLAILKLVFWRYYRVDMDDRFVYISNYFRTYRYPLGEIEAVTTSSLLPGRVYTIDLRAKGYFGRRIRFLASQALWQDYLETHPDLKIRWFGSGKEIPAA